ncbi:unnamed protein product [Trichobilharzia regenti]|nr:unnamed protein product [Trichobilharzia regenti]
MYSRNTFQNERAMGKSKMMFILDDKNKFNHDPSSEDIQLLKGTVTANLVKLRGLIAVNKDKFDTLKLSDCKLPHMYGLPKKDT